MKNIIIYLFLIGGILISSCKKEKASPANSSQPVVLSIWPNNGTGSTIVTIYGRNFSKVAQNNKVKFNGVEAVVIETTEGALQVVSPENATTGNVTVTVQDTEIIGPLFTYIEVSDEYLVSTFAGNGTAGFINANGVDARFRNIEGVVEDFQGNLIITDRANHAIRKVSPSGEVTTIAGTGVAGYIDGPVANARFSNPWKSAVDPLGNIYVADRDNHRIRKISTDGMVTTVAGSGSGFADGAAATAKFNQPIDVAVDAQGNIFVADNSNHRIRKITPAGIVSTFAGNGTGAFADGTGTAAQLRQPSGIYFDKQGNLILADRGNQRIRKITPAGVVTTIAGTGTAGYVDGEADVARFADPYGIGIDKDGNILVADLNNHKIRKLTPQGVVSTLAGSSSGYTNGINAGAQFSSPVDLYVNAAGDIFVADNSNHALRKIRKID